VLPFIRLAGVEDPSDHCPGYTQRWLCGQGRPYDNIGRRGGRHGNRALRSCRRISKNRMTVCAFASDLHGHPDRYEKLFRWIADQPPAAVFLGGDLLPPAIPVASQDTADCGFVSGFLQRRLDALRDQLDDLYPRVFLILGNDDVRSREGEFLELAESGLLEYAHDRRFRFAEYAVYGYACVPPTPFRLKDWERYDVSRYVDPGCISPEEGVRTVPIAEHDARYGTIKDDLHRLTLDHDLSRAIFLFHAPPYQTNLDRAALDGKMVDHVALDVHIGSIAVRQFIEARQPLVTLHGHVHESARLTGSWHDQIGRTHCFTAAHDGPELALVRLDPSDLPAATRELI
jgi:Icc-related predicted phosphoesterase